MSRSTAYTDYLIRHRELKLLLSVGNRFFVDPPTEESLEIGIAIGRTIVVLLGGHVEAFFNALLRECVCNLPDTWEELSFSQKRYVAMRMTEELRNNLQSEEPYAELSKIDKLRELIETIRSWAHMPKLVTSLSSQGGMKGFYRGLAPEAIESLLRRLRFDNQSFLQWIEIRGYDRSRICTVLQQLVNERTDIAHGGLTTQPTLTDARLYVVTALVVVRLADEFMRELFPGS